MRWIFQRGIFRLEALLVLLFFQLVLSIFLPMIVAGVEVPESHFQIEFFSIAVTSGCAFLLISCGYLLTNILYWISTGMLTPVIILLLLAVGWSLVLLGYMYGVFADRLKSCPRVQTLLEEIRKKPFHCIEFEQILQETRLLLEPLRCIKAVDWHPIHAEKIIEKLTETVQEMMLRLTGIDLSLCPECGKGKMIYMETLPEPLMDTS